MAFDHSKFLARFADETREHCAKLTEGLISLESSPGDSETINAIFRSAHTVKGSARMMKQTGISELAHRMEDVLDGARNGRIALTREVSDLLFKGLDTLVALVGRVTVEEKPEAPAQLLAQLAAASAGEVAPDAAGQPEPQAQDAGADSAETAESSVQTPQASAGQEASPGPQAAAKAEYLRVNAAKLDDLIRLMGEIVSEHVRIKRSATELRDIERQARRLAQTIAAQTAGTHPAAGPAAKIAEFSGVLRKALTALTDGVAMQDLFMSELQDTSLKLRMMPLSTVFAPLRRTVRDLAQEFGKEIEFSVQGEETELDRKIAERIGDSLIHLIRNSLDHGLENGADRLRAGKPAKGRISLSAGYDSGGVTIALRDDGRGLPTEKIREKALAKRLYDEETLARMSRADVNNLIFLPGFSTSRIITDISGRGVGMDVVRKSIVDELKGTVVMETEDGRGTCFYLRLPLNLAVFPLFLVRAGAAAFAIPATFVAEMLSVESGEVIEIVHKRAIRLREQIVPVEDLAAVLKLGGGGADKQSKATIVVVRDGESKLGIMVDEILAREEMVVKPLPEHLKNLRLVTGGTIGEGGQIVNVLHVPEIIRLARDVSGPAKAAAPVPQEQKGRILVVDDSINTREIEKSILEAYGYETDTAEDGQDALEKCEERLYDLVVTDVEMPRLDGFSLTEKLRADERYGNVPVIIVTSLEKEEDKRRGIAVGADAYIVKRAFDQSNLLDTVKSLIG